MREFISRLATNAGRLPRVSATSPSIAIVTYDRALLVGTPTAAVAAELDCDGQCACRRADGEREVLALAAGLRGVGPAPLDGLGEQAVQRLLDDGLDPRHRATLLRYGEVTAHGSLTWHGDEVRFRVVEPGYGSVLVVLKVPGATQLAAIDRLTGGVVIALCDIGARLARCGDLAGARIALRRAAMGLWGPPARTARSAAEALLAHAWDRFGPDPDGLGGLAARLQAVAALRLYRVTRGEQTPRSREPVARLSGVSIFHAAGHLLAVGESGDARPVLLGAPGGPSDGLSWDAGWLARQDVGALLDALTGPSPLDVLHRHRLI